MKPEMMGLDRFRDEILSHISEYFSVDEAADYIPLGVMNVLKDFRKVDNMCNRFLSHFPECTCSGAIKFLITGITCL